VAQCCRIDVGVFVTMADLLTRAANRREQALALLADLQLMERWSEVGEAVLVGATAYGLMVAPDIDIEVFCDQPRLQHAFAVLSAYAGHPRIKELRCVDLLGGPDLGIYCRIRYRHESDEVWKIDMWLMAHDHPGPQSRELVAPMQRALTDEMRAAILGIKEYVCTHHHGKLGSIHIYRAVIQAGVRSPEEFLGWHSREKPAGLTSWKPD
jgi:hypothetical protein